ncbi:hypothetical protein BKI52_21185 [marine bacterium AO1-C]|nr:hypothetical protein BKI52_21185 [marine bacterium AO1-C]
MKIKRILLLSVFLVSLGNYQKASAEVASRSKTELRKQERLLKKQRRRHKRVLKKAKRLQRFLNSRLGKWMIKRAIRKAQRKHHKQQQKTNRIDDGNNGWIIGTLVFFAAGLLMAILLAALSITNLWIAIPATMSAAFLALYFVVLRPQARRKRKKITR